MPVIQLPVLRVGMFRVEGVYAGVMELPREFAVDGLLGVDFLGRFRPAFEFDAATLVLRENPKRK